MFDSAQLRIKVRELKDEALQANEIWERDRLLGQARVYLLMAKNAAWITSTDDFIRALECGEPWPHPRGQIAA